MLLLYRMLLDRIIEFEKYQLLWYSILHDITSDLNLNRYFLPDDICYFGIERQCVLYVFGAIWRFNKKHPRISPTENLRVF